MGDEHFQDASEKSCPLLRSGLIARYLLPSKLSVFSLFVLWWKTFAVFSLLCCGRGINRREDVEFGAAYHNYDQGKG